LRLRVERPIGAPNEPEQIALRKGAPAADTAAARTSDPGYDRSSAFSACGSPSVVSPASTSSFSAVVSGTGSATGSGWPADPSAAAGSAVVGSDPAATGAVYSEGGSAGGSSSSPPPSGGTR